MVEMIINEEDLATIDQLPVASIIGSYAGRPAGIQESFTDLMATFSKGIGFVSNEIGIDFWDDLDDYEKAHEEPFEVECREFDRGCHLSYAEFYQYMKLACERYAQRYASAREPLERSLAAYKERFL